MKPSWKDAPEWANYLAMDADGIWVWYENRPEAEEYYWERGMMGRLQLADEVFDQGERPWYEAIFERPKQ